MALAKTSVLILIALSCSAGCTSSPPSSVDMGGEEGTKVAVVVEDLNEAKGDAKKMSPLFLTKPSVADSKKFNELNFYVSGKPSVSGSTASCKVSIEKQDGTSQGVQEWTLEKVGSSWKLKSSPLP